MGIIEKLFPWKTCRILVTGWNTDHLFVSIHLLMKWEKLMARDIIYSGCNRKIDGAINKDRVTYNCTVASSMS